MSLSQSAGYQSDQSRVWEAVDCYLGSSGTLSPSHSYSDYHARRTGEVARVLDAVCRKDGRCGVLVFLDGRFLGMDVLQDESLFGRLERKLVSGYALDLLDRAALEKLRGADDAAVRPVPGRPLDRPQDVLAELADTETEDFRRDDGSVDHRFRTPSLHGFAVAQQGSLVHVSAFPAGLRPTRLRCAARGTPVPWAP
jgi:hypothetical protein